jgi:tetratricopeptide (TPR) repeat protein
MRHEGNWNQPRLARGHDVSTSSPPFARTRGVLASFCSLGIAAALHSSPAFAQGSQSPTNDASRDTENAVAELMRNGVARYGKKDLEGARDAFEKAWELKRHAAIAASLAEVEMKLGRYRDAAEHLSFYLGRAPVAHDASRADAEQQLEECKKHVGRVTVAVDTPSATVFVDQVRVGAAPLEDAVWLEPGEHTLHAENGGRSSPAVRVTMVEGASLAIRLVLTPTPDKPTNTPTLASPSQKPVEMTAPKAADRPSNVKPWVLAGGGALTAVAVGVGVFYMLRANSDEGEANSTLANLERDADPAVVASKSVCSEYQMRPRECDSVSAKLNDATSGRKVATASFISAGVLGLATVGALVFWPDPTKKSPAALVSVGPWVDGRGRGFQVSGSF